jgi:hypothetical protein
MKITGMSMVFIPIILLFFTTKSCISYHYEYSKEISSNWDLADKSSTIAEKSRYIDKFVMALEQSGLKGKYNAIIFPTPNNSFDANLKALKSLQSRLQEIQTMDVTSFQYQTAIQQITAQEQGEAQDMLSVFSGIWLKEKNILLWDWIMGLVVTLSLICLCVGAMICADES